MRTPPRTTTTTTACCFRARAFGLPFLFFFFFFFCSLSFFAFAFDQEENERGAAANEFLMTTTPKLELSSSHSSSAGGSLGKFSSQRRRTFLETNESLVVRARLENGKGYARKVYLKFLLGTTTSNEEEKFEKMRDDGKYPDETANDGVYAVAVDVGKELGAKNGDVVLFRAEAWTESGDKKPLRSPKEDAKKDDREVTVVSQSQYPYYAVAIVSPSLKSDTDLPVLHVLRANEQDMTTDRGTTAKVFFDGKFYDEVKIRRRGSGRDEEKVGVELPPKD